MKTTFWQASLTASKPERTAKPMASTWQTYNRIQYSNRPDLHENRGGRMTLQGLGNILKPAKKSSSTNSSQNSNRHNNCINFNKNFDLEFSNIGDRADFQNSKNPSIQFS
jgi:hypothetical protein